MRLTGPRAENREYLSFLRREKIISSELFKQKVAVLERAEKRIQAARAKREEAREAAEIAKIKAREAAIQARERAREAKKKAAAAARKVAAATKKIAASELILRVVAPSVGEALVRDLFRTLPARSRLVLYGVDKIINGASAATDKEYKLFRKQFTVNEDSEPNWIFDSGDVLVFVKPSNLQAKLLIQRFRDSRVNHCVFQPIIQSLEYRMENASESSAKRYMQRINTLKKLEAEYLQKDGVEQGVLESDEMETVCKISGLKVTLQDVFHDPIHIWNKDGRIGAIQLRNTRENHVEPGIVMSSDAIKMSEKEMKCLWKELRASGDWFRVEGDFKNSLPSKIETLNGCFELVDDDREVCKKFDKDLGIINYKVNANKYPELNEFLKNGRIVNGWNCNLCDTKPMEVDLPGSRETLVVDVPVKEATGCADMPKAYAQFKKCKLYAGFLGHIHQFRSGSFDRAFVEKHLGFYGVRCTRGGDWLFERLGMTEGVTTVLFSQELLYFMDCGLEFEIFQGAWGSRFDFEFPEEMLKKGRYTIWSGKLGMERREVSHTIPGNGEWAGHLMAKGHKVYHWENDNLITVRRPATQVFTGHHILGGITAYLRIQMMEAMREFQPEQLVRVVMDGIYYTGEKPAALDWFSDKELKTANWSASWYTSHEVIHMPEMSRIVGNSLLTGQGGAGKTYSILATPGFHNVLYVSPTRLLGQDVYEKYGTKWTTYHKLLGIGGDDKKCRAYTEENRCPSVIVLDEGTQVPADWIDAVFERFPQCLILVIADIDETGRWYQCRSGDGENWNAIWNPALHPEVDVIEFTIDRRSRDDKLRQLKLDIRQAMKGCSAETPIMEMNAWAAANLPISTLDFQKGDTCIAGTHSTNKKLLDKGIVSGWYKKGGEVSFVEPTGFGWEKRGSFTIHAYQGKTIESGRIWIFIDDLFEYAMLYTAVSRAVDFDQLRFVRKV